MRGGGVAKKITRFNFDPEFSRKSSRAPCVPSPGPRRRVKAVPEARYLAGSFSHSPWRDDVGRAIKERPGEKEKEESGVLRTRLTKRHAEDTGVKGHGSFTFIVLRPSFLLLLFLLFLADAGCFGSRFRAASTRAGTTKGTSQREREGDIRRERESYSRQEKATSLPP